MTCFQDLSRSFKIFQDDFLSALRDSKFLDRYGIGDPTRCHQPFWGEEITNNSSRLSHLRGKVNGLMQGLGLRMGTSGSGYAIGYAFLGGIHEVTRRTRGHQLFWRFSWNS